MVLRPGTRTPDHRHRLLTPSDSTFSTSRTARRVRISRRGMDFSLESHRRTGAQQRVSISPRMLKVVPTHTRKEATGGRQTVVLITTTPGTIGPTLRDMGLGPCLGEAPLIRTSKQGSLISTDDPFHHEVPGTHRTLCSK